MAEHISLDFEEFTLGELEELEEHTGYSVMNAAQAGAIPIKAIIYMLYLQKHRVDAAFTLEDARGLHVTDFQVDSAPDPTLRSPTPLNGHSPTTADEPQASAR